MCGVFASALYESEEVARIRFLVYLIRKAIGFCQVFFPAFFEIINMVSFYSGNVMNYTD